MIHYILTFVNITNIQRLRYQLIHRCRAQLRLCVCDRYGGEWNRTGAGASATVRAQVGIGWGPRAGRRRLRECFFFFSIISLPPSHKLMSSPPSAYPIVNARATLRARHQVRRSVLFELRRYSSTTLRPLAPQHHPTRPFALTSFARAALPSCRLIKVNIFMVR
ncbi:hypothetical protein B0H11DRAFT_2233433 [Mycena galericulata]|nr:hypothetical protein B0H11DRAFT_2233433 [Mycena galericulata]